VLPPQVRAIKLWSFWNTGIYDWAQGRLQNYAFANSSRIFDYHLVKSENLLDDSLSTRYEEIKQIVEWLGSSISDVDICCIATVRNEFMGSHQESRMNGEQTKVTEVQINNRYGKWKQILPANPRLSKLIYSEGADGLEKFGYIKKSNVSTSSMVNRDEFCKQMKIEQCTKFQIKSPTETQKSTYFS
jgi:hypothetical protein